MDVNCPFFRTRGVADVIIEAVHKYYLSWAEGTYHGAQGELWFDNFIKAGVFSNDENHDVTRSGRLAENTSLWSWSNARDIDARQDIKITTEDMLTIEISIRNTLRECECGITLITKEEQERLTEQGALSFDEEIAKRIDSSSHVLMVADGPNKDVVLLIRRNNGDTLLISEEDLIGEEGAVSNLLLKSHRISNTAQASGKGETRVLFLQQESVRQPNFHATIASVMAIITAQTFDKLMTEHLIREARDTHLLYVADTNVAPEGRDADTSMMDPEDVKKLPSCMLEERQAYRDLLRDANMVDIFREMHANAGAEGFTWHTRSPTNHQFPVGMRIDMAMCTKDDYEKKFVESCEVLRYGSSDHSA